MNAHFQQIDHFYFMDPSSHPTYNILGGATFHRVAYEKNGEIVEMCEKSDNLGMTFENSLQSQINIQTKQSQERVNCFGKC
jgi:hypothetical protein